MSAVHQRDGRKARWIVVSDELLWVFELDRAGSWGRWGLMVGCAVRARSSDHPLPVNRCHVQVEYALLSEGVPDEAANSRFNDRASYFTSVFDHTHDRMGPGERRRAFVFMARDVGDVARRISTEAELHLAVSEGYFAKGYVAKHLRQ